MKKKLLSCACLTLLPATAFAVPTIYTYTGTPYTTIVDQTPPPGTYTTEMRLTGSITLADAIAADSAVLFSDASADLQALTFNDGRRSYGQANVTPGSVNISLTTDTSGAISSWSLGMFRNAPTAGILGHFLSFSSCASIACDTVFLHAAAAAADVGQSALPGSWTITAVPEPSAYALFVAGIALVGFDVHRLSKLPT